MVTINKILVPIPMEQYPESSIKRAGELADLWNAKVYFIYILEDNIFNVVSNVSEYIISERENEELKEKIISYSKSRAREIILKNLKKMFKEKMDTFHIREGNYSAVVLDEINQNNCDLVILETIPHSFIRYKIFITSPAPIWVERKKDSIKKVGLIYTNLSSNIKAPPLAKGFCKKYRAELFNYYIADPKGPKMINLNEKSEKLNRITWTKEYKGKVEEIVLKISKSTDLDLIVLDKIKSKRLLAFRQKISRYIRNNILYVI